MKHSIYKIVTLGDPAVGKTSIRRKYMGEHLNKDYSATLAADFSVKEIQKTDDHIVELQIWDIAGQQTFSIVNKTFLSKSHAAILVFDLTRGTTLAHLKDWLRKLQTHNEDTISSMPVFVVGNKHDLNGEVDDDKIDEFINIAIDEFDLDKEKTGFIKTSALTGENIDILFDSLSDILIKM